MNPGINIPVEPIKNKEQCYKNLTPLPTILLFVLFIFNQLVLFLETAWLCIIIARNKITAILLIVLPPYRYLNVNHCFTRLYPSLFTIDAYQYFTLLFYRINGVSCNFPILPNNIYRKTASYTQTFYRAMFPGIW